MGIQREAFDLKKAIIYLIDGDATTPKKLEIKMDEGNLTFKVAKTIEYRLDRGNLDTTREGDQVPLEVSIEGRFSTLISDTGEDVSPYEFLFQKGAAAAYVSTGPACEPYAVDVQVEYDVSCGTTKDEIMVFSDFRAESFDGDLKAGTISVSGKCNIQYPSSTRGTIT